MGSVVLLDLMGGLALLLWGVHGPQRDPARVRPDLHLLSRRATVSPPSGGLGLTALLQSSTATALITRSREGLVGLVPALAIMLGANVGTTLIVPIVQHRRGRAGALHHRLVGLARASRISAGSSSGSA